MYLESIVEFVGTFIFLSVILIQGQPIPTAVALLTAIYLGGKVSGGHFNPAVSFMTALRDPNFQNLIPYVIAQLGGGAAAWWVNANFLSA